MPIFKCLNAYQVIFKMASGIPRKLCFYLNMIWICHETVTNMQNKSPELVLALGDLSYQKEADCWFQMMSPLINKTRMVFGDHEYNFKNSSRLDEYLQRFNLTKQYYSFDYGNVHFLAMSSEVTI